MAEIVERGSGQLVAPVRIGTVERERAATDLGEHFAAGRLEAGEFDERVALAYQARTAADLAPLFADLPPGAAPPTGPVRSSRAHRAMPGRSVLIVALLLMSVAWIVLVRMPPFFIFPLMWFLAARPRYRRREYGRRVYGPASYGRW